MLDYGKAFKAILAGSVGLGTIVGTNMLTKLFKVDRLSNEVNTINNNIGSNNNIGTGEPFEVEFADDEFASDQEVENRI